MTQPLLPFDLAEELDHAYLHELARLQLELLKLQSHLYDSGERLLIVFEGRDAAGKGGAIFRFTRHVLNVIDYAEKGTDGLRLTPDPKVVERIAKEP